MVCFIKGSIIEEQVAFDENLDQEMHSKIFLIQGLDIVPRGYPMAMLIL